MDSPTKDPSRFESKRRDQGPGPSGRGLFFVPRLALSSQFPIRQALTIGALRGDLEARTIVVLALVEAEDLLVEVAVEVLRSRGDIRSPERALQDAPEVLDAVCMNATLDVFLGMVNHLVNIGVAQVVIRTERIGIDR